MPDAETCSGCGTALAECAQPEGCCPDCWHTEARSSLYHCDVCGKDVPASEFNTDLWDHIGCEVCPSCAHAPADHRRGRQRHWCKACHWWCLPSAHADQTGRLPARAIRPRGPWDVPSERHLPGYRHADNGTLCRTAVRVGPADPVCSCVLTGGSTPTPTEELADNAPSRNDSEAGS